MIDALRDPCLVTQNTLQSLPPPHARPHSPKELAWESYRVLEPDNGRLRCLRGSYKGEGGVVRSIPLRIFSEVREFARKL